MELIDRQALIEHLKVHCDGCGEALHCAFEAPTVDAVPVVHGRWIDKQTGAYGRWQSWCSACGKHSGIGGIESNRHKLYCPNCGAKMDGGVEP